MTAFRSCIYAGQVVHKRLAPKRHAFSYRVFALCLDLDEITEISRTMRLFSRNRRNVTSFWDADVGEAGPGDAGQKARRLLDAAGLARFGARIELVCYPRLFGYVFNPVSVYFCRDTSATVGAVIYEVTNTFGERKSYLVEARNAGAGTIAHGCDKELYVSPFTGADGRYSFHVIPPTDHIVVGVAFREADRPVLKTHFRGQRVALSDAAVLRMLAQHPLMTLKVMGAIHFEAFRLWTKGIPLVERHASPAYSVTVVPSRSQDPEHA
jgi:uncharacterized protein